MPCDREDVEFERMRVADRYRRCTTARRSEGSDDDARYATVSEEGCGIRDGE
ncbi:hypothetical protein ACLI4Q_01105 [Natrialbaceae archaeon A-CW1-1]